MTALGWIECCYGVHYICWIYQEDAVFIVSNPLVNLIDRVPAPHFTTVDSGRVRDGWNLIIRRAGAFYSMGFNTAYSYGTVVLLEGSIMHNSTYWGSYWSSYA